MAERAPRGADTEHGERVALGMLMDLARPDATVQAVLTFPRWSGSGPVDDAAEPVAVAWEVVPRRLRALLFDRTWSCSRCGTEVGQAEVGNAEVGMGSGAVTPPGLYEAPRSTTLGETPAALHGGDLTQEALLVAWHRPSVCEARRARDVAAQAAGD
jgi:hypothetical protein